MPNPATHTVTLISKAKFAQTFNLTAALAHVMFRSTRVDRTKDGASVEKEVRHMLPQSIRLPPEGRLENLPYGTQDCPEVKAALTANPPLAKFELVPIPAKEQEAPAEPVQTEAGAEVAKATEPAGEAHPPEPSRRRGGVSR